MTRPVYETKSDRGRERKVSLELAKAWSAELLATQVLSACDYVMSRDGEVKALVEIKCRSNEAARYPDYMISNDKIEKIKAAARIIGALPLLVVSFTDGIYWVDLSKSIGRVDVGGRKDRGDPSDLEQVLLISMDQFQALPRVSKKAHTDNSSGSNQRRINE